MNKNHSNNKSYHKKQNLFGTKKYEPLGFMKRYKEYNTFKKGFN